jgi:hypothetical protein
MGTNVHLWNKVSNNQESFYFRKFFKLGKVYIQGKFYKRKWYISTYVKLCDYWKFQEIKSKCGRGGTILCKENF